MKNYKNFLLEYAEIEQDELQQVISKEEAIEIIKKSPIYEKIIKGEDIDYIYRIPRTQIGSIFIQDPKKITRRSPYSSSNLYNMCFSNLDSWKEYPKRNKSLICADVEGIKKRSAYKSIFVVIPMEENAKIGVCSNYDVWESFDKSISSSYIDSFFSSLDNELGLNYDDENWYDIVEKLERFDEKRKNLIIEDGKEGPLYIRTVKDKDLVYKYVNFEISTLEFINQVFDPNENDFEIIDNYDGSMEFEKVELWTESKSLLISKNVFLEIIDEISIK